MSSKSDLLKNNNQRHKSEGSTEDLRPSVAYNRFLSMPCDSDLENVHTRRTVDIKIICRDFIFAERYICFVQTGNLFSLNSSESDLFRYNKHVYDTAFLLSPNNIRNKNKRKTFGGHSKNPRQLIARPVSVNSEVRMLGLDEMLNKFKLKNLCINPTPFNNFICGVNSACWSLF